MNLRGDLSRAASAVRGISFSHLAGLGASKAADDEDEDKKKKDARAEDEDDDKNKDKGARADDDKKDDQDREDGDAKAADDEDDGDDKKKKDAKRKSKAAEEKDDDDEDGDDKKKDASEDDDEEEMHGKSAAAQARRRERARCAAIFADKAAGKNPQLAASLAFNTSLSRTEALAVLHGSPAPMTGNAVRSSANPRLGAGGMPEVTSAQATAARWDKAFAATAIKPRR